MLILIDQDGVLANFEGRLTDIFHQRHPDVPRPTSSINFHTFENYPEQYRQELDDIPNEPDFFLSLPPIHGAVEAMHWLTRESDHQVRICTAHRRYLSNCAQGKMAWVDKHLGPEFIDLMVVTRDKTLVGGDILIDDCPTPKGSLLTPSWEHVLYDQPYNVGVEGKRRLNWTNYREVLGL